VAWEKEEIPSAGRIPPKRKRRQDIENMIRAAHLKSFTKSCILGMKLSSRKPVQVFLITKKAIELITNDDTLRRKHTERLIQFEENEPYREQADH
jgi:hypothetical protein